MAPISGKQKNTPGKGRKNSHRETMIEVIQGDITEVKVDAVVNAANNHLWMGGGVAGAIRRKGGIEIEMEAVSKGPVPVGEVVITKAGKLPAKWVIHAVVMEQDLITSREYIKEATKNSILKACGAKIPSIAFPALGTGVGGFPYKEAAKAMKEGIKETISKDCSIKKIIFVLYDKEAYDAFKKEIRKR